MKSKRDKTQLIPRLHILRLAATCFLFVGAAALAATGMKGVKLPWAAPIARVGAVPIGVDLDLATNTIYVANNASNTVSVIDGGTCNAAQTSGCVPVATMTSVGHAPIALTLDPGSHTLYATNGLTAGGKDGHSVSVLNVASCNAGNTSGCSQGPVAIVRVGFTNEQASGNISAMALDSFTHTLYVGDAHEGTVSMINAATCNALQTGGCSLAPTTMANGDAITVDPSNHSVYVNNYSGGGFLVFNGLSCNAADQSDCSATSVGQLPPDFGTVIAGVDPTTHTIYLPLAGSDILGYIAVIDSSTCNGTEHSGCGQTPPLVPVGSGPQQVLLDSATKTAFVSHFGSSSISVINTATCNATNHSGCSGPVPALATGLSPTFFAFNPQTHTLYTPSNDTNAVWVQDTSECNATHPQGCTKFASTTMVGAGAQHFGNNPAAHSIYVSNQIENTVSILDTNACNQNNLAGCNQTWPKFNVGNLPRFFAVNRATNSIYLGTTNDNTVTVIDGTTCNSSTTAGCASSAVTRVGHVPQQLAVDETSNTIYVVNQGDGSSPSTMSIIDGSHCNATDHSGCKAVWPVAPVGVSPQALTFNPDTQTIYVTNTGDDTVSVIETTHCRAGDTTGCTPVATFPVGSGPRAVGIVYDTNTLFVGNRDDLSVSVIDASTCNASDTSGCSQVSPPAVAVGAFPKTGGTGSNLFGRAIEIDQSAHTVFMPMPADDDLATLDGNICRADNVAGCKVKIVRKRMGGFPATALFDESTGTVYVANNVDGTVSVLASAQ